MFYPAAYLDREEESTIKIVEKGVIGLGYKRKGSSLNGKIFERMEVQNNPILLSTSFLKRDPSI